jgi:colanic acid/amylovoran biosynthesis protein
MSKSTKQSILISHVYTSSNNGDAAILSAQISELKRVFPDAHMTISRIDMVPEGYTYDALPVVEALMYGAVTPGKSRLRKLLYVFGMIPYTLAWAFFRRSLHLELPLPKAWHPAISALETADLQVCVGGGYLRAKQDHTSTILLLLLVHQIWLARLLGKPVYLYAQSFGPYPTKLQARIAKSGIRAASLVLVREAKSRQQLADLGISDDDIVKVPDSAFLFAAKPNQAVSRLVRPKDNTDTIVGITVRSWLDEKRQIAYETAIAELIAYIAQKPQYRVVVIPQVTSTAQHDDDREAGARIAQLLKPADNIVFLQNQFTSKEIMSVYSSLDYLVGTRFHSVIFALLSHVPAVAIEYEHKTSGIMQDLGLDKWVIPIEDVNAKRVMDLFDGIVRGHKAYHDRLTQVLPPYIAKARTAADLIAQDFTQRT